jgi:hypothetical protein
LEIILFLIWFLLSLGVAAIADTRGRSAFGYFLLSFFLSPLLGLIVVLISKDLAMEKARDIERRREEDQREQTRKRDHETQLESLRVLASKPKQNNEHVAISIADELQKLATLRDNGVLTQDEFEQQKRALLGRTDLA